MFSRHRAPGQAPLGHRFIGLPLHGPHVDDVAPLFGRGELQHGLVGEVEAAEGAAQQQDGLTVLLNMRRSHTRLSKHVY